MKRNNHIKQKNQHHSKRKSSRYEPSSRNQTRRTRSVRADMSKKKFHGSGSKRKIASAPASLEHVSKRQLKPSTLLAPVPAVIVSCRGTDSDNKANLITIAWAGTVNSEPPMVSISVKPSRYSYELIKASGEFVINMVHADLIWAADYCGVHSGRDIDKFSDCHLTAVPAAKMKYAPAIAESRLTLSCQVKNTLPLGSHDLFLAEIAAVEVQSSLFDQQDRLCLEKAELMAFAHGQYYQLGHVLGFFGFSVASADVLKKRLPHDRR